MKVRYIIICWSIAQVKIYNNRLLFLVCVIVYGRTICFQMRKWFLDLVFNKYLQFDANWQEQFSFGNLGRNVSLSIVCYIYVPNDLATERSWFMLMMALSRSPCPQYALLRAENTDPRNFRLHVPMAREASSIVTEALNWPMASSSWPITDMITNGLWLSFNFCSWLNTGPSFSERRKTIYFYHHCYPWYTL